MMSDNPLELSGSDAPFGEMLRTVSPVASTLSMAETFYRAGYAAARAEVSQASVDAAAPSPDHRANRAIVVLAAMLTGLIVGAGGMFSMTSSHSSPAQTVRSELAVIDDRQDATAVAERMASPPVAEVRLLPSMPSDSMVDWTSNAWPSRRLSLGSISTEVSRYSLPARPATGLPDQPREILTSKPITNQTLKQLSLSY